MSQPAGHDVSSPWEGDATPSDSVSDASTPSSPLMPGDTVEVLTTTQIQQQDPHPHDSLSGQVPSLSGFQEFQPDKGTILSGMKTSLIFVVLISILAVGTISNISDTTLHEGIDIEISWTDETHTNGTFTLPHAPIEKCTLGINTNPSLWWAATDCQGNIEATYSLNMGYFNNTYPWENASVTIILQQAPPNGTEITTSIIQSRRSSQPGPPAEFTGEPTISDGMSTEFTFPVNISEFETCRFNVIIMVGGNQSIDAFYSSERNNNCPSENMNAEIRESVGFIDFETGEGEFRLNNNTRFSTSASDSAGTSSYIFATYSEDQGVDSFAFPCIGILMSIILCSGWLVLMSNANREGLTKKAKGMLVGMILGSLLAASGISFLIDISVI
ncbi:MAG TPA: hypothetical protein EYQ80_00830 [Candidatus Poseidoniales archaeon]|nr:hypothetical protein [Candidatus Poseidoniales archaeon]